MRPALLTALLVFALAAAQDRGLPARSNPADYPASSVGTPVTIGADIMEPEQVRGSFSTDLSQYLVVEVGIYPKDGTTLQLDSLDFALHVDGRVVRPAEPRAIAAINQKNAASRRDDIALYPTVGMTTGTWGTGVGVGVGVGTGGNRPGPASTDRDRHVMQSELEDKGLQDGAVSKPVAGYLYFPVGSGRRKTTGYQLEYQPPGADLKLKLTSRTK